MKAIVVGGGLVGLNIALALQSKNIGVILLEAEPVRKAASYGNAGHIAIEQVEPLASAAMVKSAFKRWFALGGPLSFPAAGFREWLPFSLRLLRASAPARFAKGKAALSALIAEAMPAWKRRVSDIGATDLLREDGHFVIWETPESAAKGLAGWKATDTGTARFHEVTNDEMAQLKAITKAPIAGAIRFENTGQVSDTARLLKTLEAVFVERGGVIYYKSVAALSVEGRQAFVKLKGGEILTADRVVISAGVGSKTLLEPLGHRVPIIAERGYHIQTAQHGWPQSLPPVVFEDRSMIVTGFESGLRAASFVELNRPDAPADARKWQRLRGHVKALGLPFEGEGAEWIGSRPTLPDYLPAIGKSDKADNLYYAFGHQHLGLTLGPVTGEIVADMVTTGHAPKAFDLNRFA
ncbi:FAD-dependent oxidoreductase [Asticcacaulis sp. SL142]|uniref:NAD(P)/FAD-dependent oxidoreductase n=1 Tax=Asticcacaulis sp. SL142 TaxID=2995155 RepID=UPI00226C9689|nr:FAD-dependent oxidoreductase [Asticcacaulis sp. SL142]WAC48122.1 FAD-dependent oxidoreductase [Asticcacaulis sp. SL142]